MPRQMMRRIPKDAISSIEKGIRDGHVHVHPSRLPLKRQVLTSLMANIQLGLQLQPRGLPLAPQTWRWKTLPRPRVAMPQTWRWKTLSRQRVATRSKMGIPMPSIESGSLVRPTARTSPKAKPRAAASTMRMGSLISEEKVVTHPVFIELELEKNALSGRVVNLEDSLSEKEYQIGVLTAEAAEAQKLEEEVAFLKTQAAKKQKTSH